MDIFYDFDGTLFDTYPAMVAALVQTAVDYQVKIDRNQAYQQMRQGSLGDAIKVLARVAKVESTTIEHHFRAIENEELKNSQPFEGVKATLESVVNHGGKNYLLTHQNQAQEIEKYI